MLLFKKATPTRSMQSPLGYFRVVFVIIDIDIIIVNDIVNIIANIIDSEFLNVSIPPNIHIDYLKICSD